ncbi:MAG: hypothetical protein WC379_12575 [Methanoregula sp.]|jgi:hypothetical protein
MNNPITSIITHYHSLSLFDDNETETNLDSVFENMRGLESIINNIIIIITLSQKDTTTPVNIHYHPFRDNGDKVIIQTRDPLSHTDNGVIMHPSQDPARSFYSHTKGPPDKTRLISIKTLTIPKQSPNRVYSNSKPAFPLERGRFPARFSISFPVETKENQTVTG